MKRISQRSVLVLALAVAIGACGKTESPVDIAPAPAPGPVAPTQAVEPSAPVTFAEYAASDAPAAGTCVLDVINDAPPDNAKAAIGSQVLFSGWIVDGYGEVPSQAMLILRDAARSYSAPLIAGGDRPDVAAALGNEAARLSGYNTMTVLEIEPGEYEVSIVHGGANPMTCALNRQLIVTPA